MTKAKLKERILVVGAGEAGKKIVRELSSSNDEAKVVGMVDDHEQKQNKSYFGVRVLGPLAELANLCRSERANSIAIAIEHLDRATIWKVVDQIDFAKVEATIIPAPAEELSSEFGKRSLRELLPEDLVGRQHVPTNKKRIHSQLAGKVVFVTGAGGSIGSELCKQLLQIPIKRLVCLCRSEYSLYKLQEGLGGEVSSPKYYLGDIRDPERIEELFAQEKPDIVFHAAAHKHVLFMEQNEKEALKVNVFGTQNVLDCALKHDLGQFVFISTDKAVNPTSIMGVSKRIAEQLVQHYAEDLGLRADIVRFGNVLSSRGSVVPLFKRQIQQGGPITVTHPKALRYFMTLREAALLVINATVLSGEGGDTFFLNMGEAIEIDALVRRMAKIQGLQVGRDIDVQYTGLRIGEKVVEQLMTENENGLSTPNQKIHKLQRNRTKTTEVRRLVNTMKSQLHGLDGSGIREFLSREVAEYNPIAQKSIQNEPN